MRRGYRRERADRKPVGSVLVFELKSGLFKVVAVQYTGITQPMIFATT
ncbi:MAG: hypothetical protein OXN19_18470 [Caldilineaceae bacterium]|nr:hypothetical protein [Caldilineaceae bacterium]